MAKSFSSEYLKKGGVRDQLRALVRADARRGIGTDKPILNKRALGGGGKGHAGHTGPGGAHRGH